VRKGDVAMYTCPVCYYTRMPDPPQDYNICPCCGTEFGSDDENASWEDLRLQWIGRGAPWFFDQPPAFWNGFVQLLKANVPLPGYAFVESQSSATPSMERIIGKGVPYLEEVA